jgi:hypothetical protein
MITGNGEIVGENMGYPSISTFFPVTSRYLINTPPDQSNFEVVFILTCHLTGLAARAQAGVEVKCKLLSHFLFFLT